MKGINMLSLLIAVGALAISGCSPSTPAATGNRPGSGEQFDLLAQILDRGEIIIATEGTWSPWTYHDEDDNLAGYDVGVARLVAEKLGVRATFVESGWDGIFAGLDAQRYDMAANGVEITDERALKYDFSAPYGYIRTAIITRGDYDEIQSFEDLEGKQTANSMASTYMELAEGHGASVTGVDTLGETLELVLAERVDATLNADVSFYDYLNIHPDANLKVAALSDAAAHVSLPVRKGEESAGFLSAVNRALAELAEEGRLTELSLKYFGTDISKNQ